MVLVLIVVVKEKQVYKLCYITQLLTSNNIDTYKNKIKL